MTLEDQVYHDLRKHLDSQAVGFPKTRSKVEIRLLKHIFTPEQARIAACLNYKPEPLETVYERARGLVKTPEQLSRILNDIEQKGGIESYLKNGHRVYCNAPLVVGMYEFQLHRLTPEFIHDFDRYTADLNFGLEFLGTALPQMRTIPIRKSVPIHSHTHTFDEVFSLLDGADGQFAIVECICRKKKRQLGSPCQVTGRTETCMALGDFAAAAARNHMGRLISHDEAISILEKNQQEGMIFQPSNTQQADFICSCCGCCCGMLRMHKSIPKPVDFWASNYFAAMNSEQCSGCGKCAEKCQVDAIVVKNPSGKPSEKQVSIDLNRCLGCGVCVAVCPARAMSLTRKPIDTLPPATREDLLDTLMAERKGLAGKLRLTGKLIWDALSTNQSHLLKR